MLTYQCDRAVCGHHMLPTFYSNRDSNVNIKDSATQDAPSVKIIDVTLGELNIMLQKAGADARKKGEDQILQITSRVEIRYGGGWDGKRARSFDFIPVCSMESAFLSTARWSPFRCSTSPPTLWSYDKGVRLTSRDRRFPFFRGLSFLQILSLSATCCKLSTFKLINLYSTLRIIRKKQKLLKRGDLYL